VCEAPTEARWSVDRATLRRLWLGLSIDVAPALRPLDAPLTRRQCPRCRLGFHHPPLPADDRWYAALLARRWYTVTDKFEHAEALRWLPPPQRVFDCGAGRRPLGPAPGLDVVTDPPADPVDAVTSFQVLEHVPAPLTFLAQCRDWVRPGGRVLIGVPDQDSYLGHLSSLPLDLPPHHLSHWSALTLRTALQRVGLRLEALRRAPEERWERVLAWTARVAPDPAGPPSLVGGLRRALMVGLGSWFAPRLPGSRTGATLLAVARRPTTEGWTPSPSSSPR
jgi:SAM-dependent methyltransferase